MSSLLPAFVGGMPGGMELLIIFFIMALLFGVPVVLALFLGYRYVRGQAAETEKEERIAELESELSELREQVDEVGSDGSSGATGGNDLTDGAAETNRGGDDE